MSEATPAGMDWPDTAGAGSANAAPGIARPDRRSAANHRKPGRRDGDRRERLVDPAERELALLQDADSRRLMESGIEAVKVAVELGADVNATNKAGDTALHGAARHGFSTVIRFLAEKGAHLDIRNQRGQTPAMAAAGAREKDRVVLEDLFRTLAAR